MAISIPANSNSDQTITQGNKPFINSFVNHHFGVYVYSKVSHLFDNQKLHIFLDAKNYIIKIATEKNTYQTFFKAWTVSNIKAPVLFTFRMIFLRRSNRSAIFEAS